MAKNDYNEDPLLSASVLMKDKRLNLLLSYYKIATKKLTSELENATDFGRSYRIRTLKSIDEILKTLDSKTSDWFKKEVEEYYKTYGDYAVDKIKGDGFPVASSFNVVDQKAIQALTDEIMTYYRDAYSGVKRSAMRMLNEAARSQVQTLLATGRISGEDRRTISDRIAGYLKQGFTALTDRGGRKWTLEAYAEMLTRTMLVKTANEGVKNRLGQAGYDLVQVSSHSASCSLCGPWEGKILSMSARSNEYDSVDKAEANGLFHPNCRHRLLPYHQSLLEVSTVWDSETQTYIKL